MMVSLPHVNCQFSLLFIWLTVKMLVLTFLDLLEETQFYGW